jgi:hypothetical protein
MEGATGSVVRYRRNLVSGATSFFAVALADRHSTRLVDHISILRVAFRTAWSERPFAIDTGYAFVLQRILMFAICSGMSTALLDTAALEAEAALPGTDCATLDHMRRWLVRLARIAGTLGDRMNRTAASRRADPTAARSVDLDMGWALVTRAIRWTVALQVRFLAECKAAAKIVLAARFGATAKAASKTRESRQDAAAPAPVRRKPGAGAAAGAMPPDRCIAGKSLAEVVAQICADLGVAATLLEGRPEAAEIAAIAAAARAFLGGPDETWTARPLPRASLPAVRPPAMREAAPAVAAAALVAVTAPDTG